MNDELQRVTGSLDRISGWDKLTPLQRAHIHQGTVNLFTAVGAVRAQEIGWGKFLDEAMQTLKKEGLWIRYLRHIRLSPKVALRWIERYHSLRTIPANVQDFARMRGISEITPAIRKALPPPRSDKPEVIEAYLDKVQSMDKRERRAVKPPVSLVQKRTVLFAGSRNSELPDSWGAKDRVAFWTETAGMIFAKVGIQGAQMVHPVRPPEPGKPGRPRESRSRRARA